MLDIQVQCGVYVLIGVNELGTQSRVSVYIIYGYVWYHEFCFNIYYTYNYFGRPSR